MHNGMLNDPKHLEYQGERAECRFERTRDKLLRANYKKRLRPGWIVWIQIQNNVIQFSHITVVANPNIPIILDW